LSEKELVPKIYHEESEFPSSITSWALWKYPLAFKIPQKLVEIKEDGKNVVGILYSQPD
jgi:hypothetical protein